VCFTVCVLSKYAKLFFIAIKFSVVPSQYTHTHTHTHTHSLSLSLSLSLFLSHFTSPDTMDMKLVIVYHKQYKNTQSQKSNTAKLNKHCKLIVHCILKNFANCIKWVIHEMRQLLVMANVPSSPIPVTLMMEALSSSETSVLTWATWSNIPVDTFLHSHCRENLKFYMRQLLHINEKKLNVIFLHPVARSIIQSFSSVFVRHF
jgi:hypothetical protein